MKLFTVPQANALLPTIKPMLEGIRDLYARIDADRANARLAAMASDAGGGMRGGTLYLKVLYEVGRLTTQIHELGIELKDPHRGLIDFPSMRNGRVVLLCWQLGEGGEIAWWHETDAGFAGRQPL